MNSLDAIDEILGRLQISHVAETLGVKLNRSRNRCVAPWRQRADGWNVSITDAKNTYYDHVDNKGGGLIDFVGRIFGCDRKTAVRWLADHAGVTLHEQSEAERRQWLAARPRAEALVKWKLETLASLRYHRGRVQRTYHNAVRFLLSHDYDECERRGDLRFEIALGIGETYWERVEAMDAQIDRLEAASYADLLEQLGGVA
jgi:hypothetical protein